MTAKRRFALVVRLLVFIVTSQCIVRVPPALAGDSIPYRAKVCGEWVKFDLGLAGPTKICVSVRPSSKASKAIAKAFIMIPSRDWYGDDGSRGVGPRIAWGDAYTCSDIACRDPRSVGKVRVRFTSEDQCKKKDESLDTQIEVYRSFSIERAPKSFPRSIERRTRLEGCDTFGGKSNG